MQISNIDYLKEFLQIVRLLNKSSIRKSKKSKLSARKSYIKQYLKDHRNINL